MNAEYTNESNKLVGLVVTPDGEGAPPRTARVTERSACGKWIYEHVLVYSHFDVTHDVAVYTLLGTGKKPI